MSENARFLDYKKLNHSKMLSNIGLSLKFRWTRFTEICIINFTAMPVLVPMVVAISWMPWQPVVSIYSVVQYNQSNHETLGHVTLGTCSDNENFR